MGSQSAKMKAELEAAFKLEDPCTIATEDAKPPPTVVEIPDDRYGIVSVSRLAHSCLHVQVCMHNPSLFNQGDLPCSHSCDTMSVNGNRLHRRNLRTKEMHTRKCNITSVNPSQWSDSDVVLHS